MRKAIPKNLPGASITLIIMTEEDKAMVPGKELILGLFAQSATKNAKSHSSRAATVRYIARNVFQSAKQAACLTQTGITGSKKEIFPGNAILIKGRLKKGKNPLRRKSHFFTGEKNALKHQDKS